MPWQNKLILAMVPVVLFVAPSGGVSDRLRSVAACLVGFAGVALFAVWQRWHDARAAERHVARQRLEG